METQQQQRPGLQLSREDFLMMLWGCAKFSAIMCKSEHADPRTIATAQRDTAALILAEIDKAEGK